MLVLDKRPMSVAAEAYRSLRTSIEYSSIDRKLKTIVITSSEQGEGKTTVVGNLAIAMAENDKKVIAIDCDLRKPSLHKSFRLSNEAGLTEYIVGKEQFGKIVQKISENLHIITSGKVPPNPSELLDSKSLEKLLEELREFYDYIIIDTPPVRAVTDSQILAGKVDGTMIVIKSEDTTEESAMNAYKELKKVNANIIGTVLNGIDVKHGYGYYKSYYGEEETKKSKRRFRKNKK